MSRLFLSAITSDAVALLVILLSVPLFVIVLFALEIALPPKALPIILPSTTSLLFFLKLLLFPNLTVFSLAVASPAVALTVI